MSALKRLGLLLGLRRRYRSLEITTRIGCRLQCSYCPQSASVNAYSSKRNGVHLLNNQGLEEFCIGENTGFSMSLDTFKRCLATVPRDVVIVFSGFSEPWLNPACTQMVLWAHENGFKVKIFTTGAGMTHSDVDIIKRIPITAFNLHSPDSVSQMRLVVDEKYLGVTKELLQSGIKEMVCSSPNGGLEMLDPKLKQLVLESGTPVHRPRIISRARNLQIKGVPLPERIEGPIGRCSRIDRHVLLPNGDVVLCCMDWGMKHVIGNLLVSDYSSLSKSEEYLKIIKGIEDDSIDTLCRTCEWPLRPGRKARIKHFIKTKLFRMVK